MGGGQDSLRASCAGLKGIGEGDRAVGGSPFNSARLARRLVL